MFRSKQSETLRSESSNQMDSYLDIYSIPDLRRKKLKHLQITAEKTHRPHAGIAALARLLIAEGVHDVDHYRGRISDGMGVSVSRHPHLLSFHSAVTQINHGSEDTYERISN